MQMTAIPRFSPLVNPDDLTDIDQLRAALKNANELAAVMAASTRNAKSAIDYLTGMIAPVVVAHQRGDHSEVKRLLDAYIESGEVQFVPAEKPVAH